MLLPGCCHDRVELQIGHFEPAVSPSAESEAIAQIEAKDGASDLASTGPVIADYRDRNRISDDVPPSPTPEETAQRSKRHARKSRSGASVR